MQGDVAAMQTLLDTGADVNAEDNMERRTAFLWAASNGHADTVEVLLGAGARTSRSGRNTQEGWSRGITRGECGESRTISRLGWLTCFCALSSKDRSSFANPTGSSKNNIAHESD